MTQKYFFFGFGQVAKHFVSELIRKKQKFKFDVTTTSATKKRKFRGKSYLSLKFNGKEFDHKILNALKTSEYLLVSIPPLNGSDLVLSKFGKIIKSNNFKRIIYLSATSVYGNHQGNWVNEKSTLKPSSKFGRSRFIAEQNWINSYKKYKINLVILRLAGIYSIKNNPLKRLKEGPKIFISKKNQFFSRIRLEDISKVLIKAFKNKKIIGETFNISDDLPASSEEVAKYSAKLLGIKKLKSISYQDLKGEMIKAFYKDSKKISNKKMKKILKIKLLFPNYKFGLQNIFRKSI